MEKINSFKYVNYLGIFIDSHLNWEFQLEILVTKLSHAIGMLSKIRHYVPKDTLLIIMLTTRFGLKSLQNMGIIIIIISVYGVWYIFFHFYFLKVWNNALLYTLETGAFRG